MILTWGTVTTTNAPTDRVLEFCAHHLDLGAHRVYVYLDNENEELYGHLRRHPKTRPIKADLSYWQRRGVIPPNHRSRQMRNLRNTYFSKRQQVDWLFHLDVDEFLWPRTTVYDAIRALPKGITCTTIPVIENLVPNDPADPIEEFRAPLPKGLRGDAIYGPLGGQIISGLWGHEQGKPLFEHGHQDVVTTIHTAQINGVSSFDHTCPDIHLCHIHARSADEFVAHMAFRHAQGSYRSELLARVDIAGERVNMHSYLSALYDAGGPEAWRAAFLALSQATPHKRAALEQHGLYFHCPLELEEKRQRYFGHG